MEENKYPNANLPPYLSAVNFNRTSAYDRHLASKADIEYRAMRRRLGLDPPLPTSDQSINEARALWEKAKNK